jgi:hypothetical protein
MRDKREEATLQDAARRVVSHLINMDRVTTHRSANLVRSLEFIPKSPNYAQCYVVQLYFMERRGQ